MHKFIFALTFFLLIQCNFCYALDVNSNNGYDWKKASYQEKKEACEVLVNNNVRPLGESVVYWMNALNEFYYNTNDMGLRMTIWESALAMHYMTS